MKVKPVGVIKCDNWSRTERGIARVIEEKGECMVKVKYVYNERPYPFVLTFYEEDVEIDDE